MYSRGFVIPVLKKILVVCVGNICRSPMAEHLFRHHMSHTGARFTSAGIGALVGKPMDEMALKLLAEHGIDGADHRARQLSVSMLREADLVLAMEREHLRTLTCIAPEASGKMMLLDRWVSAADIPDPYRQSREAFEHVFGMIEQGMRKWMTYMQPVRNVVATAAARPQMGASAAHSW